MSNSHQQLIDTIKYSELPNGTVVIKVGDSLIFGNIKTLNIDMEVGSLTEYTLTGYVVND